MKELTEAQVMGFRGAMVPPTRSEHRVDASLTREQVRAIKNKAATRRAIREHQERRELEAELEKYK